MGSMLPYIYISYMDPMGTRYSKNQAEWGCHGTLQGDLEVQLELLLWITMVIPAIFVGTRAPYNYGYILLYYTYNWNCPPKYGCVCK